MPRPRPRLSTALPRTFPSLGVRQLPPSFPFSPAGAGIGGKHVNVINVISLLIQPVSRVLVLLLGRIVPSSWLVIGPTSYDGNAECSGGSYALRSLSPYFSARPRLWSRCRALPDLVQ